MRPFFEISLYYYDPDVEAWRPAETHVAHDVNKAVNTWHVFYAKLSEGMALQAVLNSRFLLRHVAGTAPGDIYYIPANDPIIFTIFAQTMENFSNKPVGVVHEYEQLQAAMAEAGWAYNPERRDVVHPPAGRPKKGQGPDWSVVDWSMPNAHIARKLGVSAQSVALQKKKRRK
ncbi:MAG: hypothetical protein FWH34_02895 [Desulfovibrionaceae bacterium]|nr:hypothetical protein [Desulfovibrionaceae bacterium]